MSRTNIVVLLLVAVLMGTLFSVFTLSLIHISEPTRP